MITYKTRFDPSAWGLKEIARRLDDLRPPLKTAGSEMMRVIERDRFRQEKGPDGAPWKPLSAYTKARRSNQPILTQQGPRGGLRGSISYRATRRTLTIGANKRYARIHQLGGKAGRGHRVTIPARPYLGYSKRDLDRIGEGLRGYIFRRAATS